MAGPSYIPVIKSATSGDFTVGQNLTVSGFLAMNAGQSGTGFTVYTGSAKGLVCGTVGGGLAVKEGTNARSGIAVLAAGTVTVANSSITASTRIQLTTQVPGGTVGAPYVSAVVAGTSFTITSTAGAADTSTVAYFLVEPA